MIEFFYKISISKNDFKLYGNYEDFITKYKELMEKDKIKETMKNFTINGKNDGNKIQANWFPEINADVFISHSHDDKELAKALGGFILKNAKLKPFIDSEVWGYSNELLKNIDNKYCKIKNKNFYDYELRNHSTSHVHMMLSVALMQMISKSKYFIFLDTPNSNESNNTLIKDNDINKTNSPWIYYELIISKILCKIIENAKNNILATESLKHFSDISISYEIYTKDLEKINDLKSLIEKLKIGGNNNV